MSVPTKLITNFSRLGSKLLQVIFKFPLNISHCNINEKTKQNKRSFQFLVDVQTQTVHSVFKVPRWQMCFLSANPCSATPSGAFHWCSLMEDNFTNAHIMTPKEMRPEICKMLTSRGMAWRATHIYMHCLTTDKPFEIINLLLAVHINLILISQY